VADLKHYAGIHISHLSKGECSHKTIHTALVLVHNMHAVNPTKLISDDA
jgi:hypothetical protein